MPQKKRKPIPSLTFDPKTRRYRDERGRFVSRSTILDARDRIVRDTEDRLVRITERYAAGEITLVEWQLEFRDTIRAAHTLAAGIAMGGKNAMTPADWGRVGQLLRVQYEALNRFALHIEAGGAPHMGRVRQYARAVRSTFLNAERLRMPIAQQARWIRTRKESCPDCIEQSERGPQPITNFPAIGSLRCRHNCGCFLEPA